jgi:hypothetical protein
MKRISLILLLVLSLVAALPAWAGDPHCQKVGGVLMTNIGAIEGVTNLGPVFGDLQGSVAATIVGGSMEAGFDIQHYWVTASGDTIKFKLAHLTPTPAGDVVAIRWGDYKSKIDGGTGKYDGAKGELEYFGLADFAANTLVLRYRGEVCNAH